MKFRNKATGRIYDRWASTPCAQQCKRCALHNAYPELNDYLCTDIIEAHPEAAAIMGYEVLYEPGDPIREDPTSANPTRAIAIDFDGTLFKTRWPEILEPNRYVIDRALDAQRNGAQLILWTCREGKLLEDALAACEKEGLHFDAVNDSTEDWKRIWGTSPRKIGATEYWDDRAVNPLVWEDGDPVSTPKWTRAEVLDTAKRCVCGDREQDYGSPEQSLSAISRFWADYIKAKYGAEVPLTGADASAMMVLFKMARVATGHGKADNWVDTAGYAACGGEIEAQTC